MDAEQKKQFVKHQKIPLKDAWALVAMADRINAGEYIKFPEFDQATGNVSRRPNREIIKDQVALGLVNISDADREFAEKMSEHFQGIAFDAISKTLGDFDQKILNFITHDEVDANMGMAYLACMAVRYRREIVKEHKAEVLLKVGGTSTPQGSIGQHLRLKVSVIAKFAGKVFAGSVVRATDGTNLYFWTSSKEVDMWPDSPEEFEIIGVVKAHGNDRDNAHETRLTRVKITY
ncbi:hypothetical protein UFOVP71_225 [uncultured Caudovirales phage]|uniref:Uncharacterized protein n=1 Tax=uncultured Caudovirales phage TaxID=2100421 RepID=A0A6J5TCL3_9CAUD|nr:hypothetical protein UFOVP71_225 [uncultured Caudovirales phage]